MSGVYMMVLGRDSGLRYGLMARNSFGDEIIFTHNNDGINSGQFY